MIVFWMLACMLGGEAPTLGCETFLKEGVFAHPQPSAVVFRSGSQCDVRLEQGGTEVLWVSVSRLMMSDAPDRYKEHHADRLQDYRSAKPVAGLGVRAMLYEGRRDPAEPVVALLIERGDHIHQLGWSDPSKTEAVVARAQALWP